MNEHPQHQQPKFFLPTCQPANNKEMTINNRRTITITTFFWFGLVKVFLLFITFIISNKVKWNMMIMMIKVLHGFVDDVEYMYVNIWIL